MAKVTNAKGKVVIKLDMKRLLVSKPYVKIDGKWAQADGTVSAILSNMAYFYVKGKRPEMFAGRTFCKTEVELVGDEFVVTFTEILA